MPTVPLYQQSQRMRPSLGLPRRAPEGIGGAWENLGNKLGVAAADLQRRAQERKDTQDTLDVMNAYSDYRDQEREFKFELSQRKERDARGITQDHKTWAEKTKGEITKNLSPGAQAKFSQVFAQHINSELDATAKQEAGEFRNYQDGTAKRALLEAQGELAAAPWDSRKIVKDYETKLELIYGRVDKAKRMEDRAQLLEQGAEDLAAQGKFKEALDLISDNVKSLGSKHSELKDKITDLVMSESERLDAAAEKKVKKAQERREDDLYLAIQKQFEDPESVEAPITLRALNDDMAMRRITREAHGRLKKMLSDPDSYEDNPHVIADIIDEADPDRKRRMLDQALDDRQIKPSTYTSNIKSIVDDEYKDAEKKINSMLKPPPFYMGQDKWVRYAEGMDYFRELVKHGKSPQEAAEQVANSYIADIRRSQKGLPQPKYMPSGGDKANLTDIEASEQMTIAAYQAGELQTWEYEAQMKLLATLKEHTIETQSIESELSGTSGRVVTKAGVQ